MQKPISNDVGLQLKSKTIHVPIFIVAIQEWSEMAQESDRPIHEDGTR